MKTLIGTPDPPEPKPVPLSVLGVTPNTTSNSAATWWLVESYATW